MERIKGNGIARHHITSLAEQVMLEGRKENSEREENGLRVRERERGQEDKNISQSMVEVMLTLKDRGINMSRASNSKQPEIKERPIQYEENT